MAILANLSRREAWIKICSSALSPSFMWSCLERSGLAVGWFSRSNRGCWTSSTVDRGLLNIHKLRRLTKNDLGKIKKCFPHSDSSNLFSKVLEKNVWYIL